MQIANCPKQITAFREWPSPNASNSEHWPALYCYNLLNANSCWFTETSKTPSGAGVYSHGSRTEVSTCFCSYATIFQADAIDLYVERLLIAHKIMKIFSDNQATLKAICSHWIMSKLALTWLSSMGRLKKLSLIWIPSQTGLEGNDTADSFGECTANGFASPEPVSGISLRSRLLAKSTRFSPL